MNDFKSICVFCGSSDSVHADYLLAAREMGKLLAKRNIRLIYGGGKTGLMGAIADGVIATSATGLITRMNPVAAQLTGMNSSEAIGKHIDEIVSVASGQQSPFANVLHNGETIPYHEVWLSQREQDNICVALSHAPIRGSNDELTGTVAVLRDISEAKRLEKQLVETERLNTIGLMASGIAHDSTDPILCPGLGNLFPVFAARGSNPQPDPSLRACPGDKTPA